MKCPECNSDMYINELMGWVWECSFCDETGPHATEDDIIKYEAERSVLYNLFVRFK